MASAIKLVHGRATKILLLNPNSSQSMTDGMSRIVAEMDLPYSTEIFTYTAPAGSPASINDGDGIRQSTEAVLADLQRCNDWDGVLVACFSVHPLVTKLPSLPEPPRAVMGIFEASILTALSLLGPDQQWGIVTTGKFWEAHLTEGVSTFIGTNVEDKNNRFAGVESTGLNASDFHHGVDPAVVTNKIKEATKRLLSNGRTSCIVMGCAGMAGLEDTIRSAAAEEVDEHFAYSVLHVVDGVRAGIMQLELLIKQQGFRRG
ncbi:Asp/Glu/hydantoin racemase [Xylariomycetidae sp. FL0641]|nr:Asp/Glu/hydantoin racemase [Xylariomycetidae sp. FL0641]